MGHLELELRVSEWCLEADWVFVVGLVVRYPLGEVGGEAVVPGPRRFFTCAYKLPSIGPLV